MNNVITVTGVDPKPPRCVRVEVDEYVPLRFRTYEGSLGARYVRLGNLKNSLIELLLDQDSTTVRGFTLTCFRATHEAREIRELPQTDGLPIVAVPDNFRGPVDAQRLDVATEFSVGFGGDFVEVDIGGLSAAEEIIRCDRVQFLVRASCLVGIRVVGLSPQQVAMIGSGRGHA